VVATAAAYFSLLHWLVLGTGSDGPLLALMVVLLYLAFSLLVTLKREQCTIDLAWSVLVVAVFRVLVTVIAASIGAAFLEVHGDGHAVLVVTTVGTVFLGLLLAGAIRRGPLGAKHPELVLHPLWADGFDNALWRPRDRAAGAPLPPLFLSARVESWARSDGGAFIFSSVNHGVGEFHHSRSLSSSEDAATAARASQAVADQAHGATAPHAMALGADALSSDESTLGEVSRGPAEDGATAATAPRRWQRARRQNGEVSFASSAATGRVSPLPPPPASPVRQASDVPSVASAADDRLWQPPALQRQTSFVPSLKSMSPAEDTPAAAGQPVLQLPVWPQPSAEQPQSSTAAERVPIAAAATTATAPAAAAPAASAAVAADGALGHDHEPPQPRAHATSQETQRLSKVAPSESASVVPRQASEAGRGVATADGDGHPGVAGRQAALDSDGSGAGLSLRDAAVVCGGSAWMVDVLPVRISSLWRAFSVHSTVGWWYDVERKQLVAGGASTSAAAVASLVPFALAVLVQVGSMRATALGAICVVLGGVAVCLCAVAVAATRAARLRLRSMGVEWLFENLEVFRRMRRFLRLFTPAGSTCGTPHVFLTDGGRLNDMGLLALLHHFVPRHAGGPRVSPAPYVVALDDGTSTVEDFHTVVTGLVSMGTCSPAMAARTAGDDEQRLLSFAHRAV
jgi:hypothetical protein